ncbi:histone deacetylase complex subunit SAP30L-like [Styela clava]
MTLDHHHGSGKKRKRRESGDTVPDTPQVGLINLQMNTLRRYKRHFKLQTRPGMNKAQLAETVQRHFSSFPVVEKEALAYFIYMVKMKKNRIDLKESGNSNENNNNNSTHTSEKKESK